MKVFVSLTVRQPMSLRTCLALHLPCAPAQRASRAHFVTPISNAGAAVAAEAAGPSALSPDGWLALEYNERPYNDRGGCSFEGSVSVELIARLSKYPKMEALLNGLTPKLISLSAERAAEPVAWEAREGGRHVEHAIRCIEDATFTGTGEEEYLIIGCFGGDASIDEEKVKRPTGKDCYMGQPQQPQAYYYVEYVKVEAITALSECKCGAADERDMDLVYGSSSNLPDDATAKQRIEDAGIYYAFLKRMPTTAGKNTISSIVALLNDNPSMNLDIVGHCDDDEFNEGKINVRYKDIGKKRAGQVKRLLEAAGVDHARLKVTGRENTDPASTRDSEIARAQNRRVTFLVK